MQNGKPMNNTTQHTSNTAEQNIWSLLSTIEDPEIPVLTITDLGIVRKVQITDEAITIFITPTYSGCPATDMIAATIKMTLLAAGYKNIILSTVLSPAWTTDWMTAAGKQKLKDYGIAAPNKQFIIPADGVPCPHCNSHHTKLLSEFGSTACKALYQCQQCKEPFDYFKCH